MKTINKVDSNIRKEFKKFYDEYPLSFVVINEDGSARCAVLKKENSVKFLESLRDALCSEIDSEVKISFEYANFNDYSFRILAEWEYDGMEEAENFTIESCGIY